MALLEKISEDLKAAMKSGDKLRLETLRTMRAALLEKQVERRPAGGMTAEDETAALIGQSKKRKEAIDIYRKNGREDLAVQEEHELEIIQQYLPKPLSADELELIIRSVISAASASSQKDFGKVMGLVMKETRGRADGKVVQDTVRKLIGELQP